MCEQHLFKYRLTIFCLYGYKSPRNSNFLLTAIMNITLSNNDISVVFVFIIFIRAHWPEYLKLERYVPARTLRSGNEF